MKIGQTVWWDKIICLGVPGTDNTSAPSSRMQCSGSVVSLDEETVVIAIPYNQHLTFRKRDSVHETSLAAMSGMVVDDLKV